MAIEWTANPIEQKNVSVLARLRNWLIGEPPAPAESECAWPGYVEPPQWETGFRKAVFLDFDGVLHRGTSGTLRHLGRLEEYLSQWPDVGVVVVSDWRIGDSLQSLKGYFTEDFRDRVFARTGEVDQGPYQRQREVTDLVAVAGIDHYLVLDDGWDLYDVGFEPLITPDPDEGITEDDLAILGGYIEKWG